MAVRGGVAEFSPSGMTLAGKYGIGIIFARLDVNAGALMAAARTQWGFLPEDAAKKKGRRYR